MKIGLFSGSFNPIHIGHLVLGNYLREFTCLDEVWFAVTPHNPLKNQDDLLDDRVRLEMVRLALEDHEGLFVSDIEFRMPRPSYTVDTLAKLEQEYPGNEFILIIGGDNWSIFDQWKKYDRLLQNYKILIYPRRGEKIDIPAEHRMNVQVVEAPVVEVSSTFIRDGIKGGKNMRSFLPKSVYEYIVERGLYKEG